jgi:TonB family protein
MRKMLFLLLFISSVQLLVAQTLDSIYINPVLNASYAGGDSALTNFIQIRLKNDKLHSESISNTVFVQYVVEKSGLISQAEILQGINPEFDAEIIQMVKSMTKWKPAIVKGKPVRSLSLLPIGVVFSDEAMTGTTYYDGNWRRTSENLCAFYRTITKKNQGYVVEYFDNERIKIEIGEYSSLTPAIRNGHFCSFYRNGAKKSEYSYVRDLLNGDAVTYYENGNIQEKATFVKNLKEGLSMEYMDDGTLVVTKKYEHGVMVSEKYPFRLVTDSTNFDSDIVKNKDLILPHFPNGDDAMTKFIDKNLVYPSEAKKQEIHGEVITQFVVEADGRLTDIQVIQSVHPLLDNEAVRVAKLMPKWVPALKKGKPVKVKFTWHAKF